MITIDDIEIKQPARLNEFDNQYQATKVAIDGSKQRDKFGDKKAVVMSWAWLRPADYRQLVGLFASGAPVVYKNTNSAKTASGTFEFTGLSDFDEDEYLKGASLVKPLSVRIEEA